MSRSVAQFLIVAGRARSRVFQRVSSLCLIGLPAYCIGVYARWSYILQVHHPRNHVYSDSIPLATLAEILTTPDGRQEFFHTVWPPGMSAFLALNLVFDPSLGSAAVWQFVLSAASPLLIAHAAWLAYGERVAWLALAMSALHFGFIHYGGFFLSEALFQFALAVAVSATVSVLVASERPPKSDGPTAKGATWTLLVGGLVSGLAWGLSFSLRSNALPVAFFAAFWLCVRWARRRNRRAFVALAGGILGMLLVVTPLTQRCTQLVGHFCPGATNGAMNIALGHAPDVHGLHFVPGPGDRHDLGNWWFPPALEHHGYKGTADVTGSIYDTPRVLSWVMGRFVRDPVEFGTVSIGNALDLFGPTLWPEDYAPLAPRRATILGQAVLVLVLIPGMAMWGLIVRDICRRREIACTDAFFTAVILGVFLVAAASLGEARYRIPFDAVFVLLAARALAGRKLATDAPPPRVGGRAYLGVMGPPVAFAAVMVVAVPHTQLRLAARLRAAVPSRSAAAALAGTVDAARFGARRADGTPWDAAGNFQFRCKPSCPELRVDLGSEHKSQAIEVSADHNDRYEVVFYRQGEDVGRIPLEMVDAPDGLKTTRHDVPQSARAAGYDSLGIRPLYGDGKYSVGHVHLIE
jgi:hypothetical protein